MEYAYTGAPDECSVHWPTKGVTGYCAECAAENGEPMCQKHSNTVDYKPCILAAPHVRELPCQSSE